MQIFADKLLEMLLHFEQILSGELGLTYADIKESFINYWGASSLYDTTLDNGSNSTITLADRFDKYAGVLPTLEAGAVALRRASEIHLHQRKQPSCVINIPGSIARIDLEADVDSMIIDTSQIFVVKGINAATIVQDLVDRGLIELLHSTNEHIIVKALDSAQSVLADINETRDDVAAVLFDTIAEQNDLTLLNIPKRLIRSESAEI